jgi:hypothetical protein
VLVRLISVVGAAIALAVAGCGGAEKAAPVQVLHNARVFGRFAVCSLDNSPCAPGAGSINAVDVRHRVVASAPVVHGRFSLLLPGRYMLHANQRYGWCHRYRSCNVYRAVLAVAHQPLRVELDVPPPPSARCVWHGAALVNARVYQDPAGWTAKVPDGWHVLRFSGSDGGVSGAGAQISNVRLPAPRVISGYPVQTNGRALPARGVGLVIATDNETGLPGKSHGYIKVPPLPAPSQCGWNQGSALGGQPYLETLWFRGNNGNHGTFVASVKVGPKATGTDLAAIDSIIHSLQFRRSGH